jgi:hypothetical protein
VAKRKRAGNPVADRIAEYIGKSIGDLVNRKETLQKQLADVEGQLTDVRRRVAGQLGAMGGRDTSGTRAKKAAAKVVKQVRRAISPATRAKMAASAKKRWAATRKAAKAE